MRWGRGPVVAAADMAGAASAALRLHAAPWAPLRPLPVPAYPVPVPAVAVPPRSCSRWRAAPRGRPAAAADRWSLASPVAAAALSAALAARARPRQAPGRALALQRHAAAASGGPRADRGRIEQWRREGERLVLAVCNKGLHGAVGRELSLRH